AVEPGGGRPQVGDRHPAECRDVARHGQRQGRHHGHRAPPRQVGPGDQERGPDADDQAPDGHDGAELQAAQAEAQDPLGEHRLQPRGRAVLPGADQQVGERDQRDRGGDQRAGGQRARGWSRDAQANPASAIIWTVVCRSARSLRSMSGVSSRVSAGRPSRGSTPSIIGYSWVSSRKYSWASWLSRKSTNCWAPSSGWSVVSATPETLTRAPVSPSGKKCRATVRSSTATPCSSASAYT